MQRLQLTELVLNFELYPRVSVDSRHVSAMVDSLAAGMTLPPLVVDEKSRQIVDGFHRYYAMKRFVGKKWQDASVDVVLRKYATPQAMFVDAMRLNSGHGRNLTAFDKAHCVLLAERMKIKPSQVASSLAITVERVGELRSERVGILKTAHSATGQSVPLKNIVKHMAGQKPITTEQSDTQKKLGGMDQAFTSSSSSF